MAEDFAELDKIAPLFQALTKPQAGIKPSCDMMSDAIVWLDEVPFDNPTDWSIIRSIQHYRMGLIIQEPRPQYEAHWHYARKRFPNWIGFAEERCTPNEALALMYRAWRAKSEDDIKKLNEWFGVS